MFNSFHEFCLTIIGSGAALYGVVWFVCYVTGHPL